MKKQARIYFTFEDIKKCFGLPEDALLKYMEANNDTEEIDITFYTDSDTGYVCAPGALPPIKKANS